MRTVLIILFITATLRGLAQSDIRWPNDTSQAQQNVALYTDALRAQEYSTGREPLRWLVTQAPDLHESLYVKGEKLYRGLIEQTSDPDLRQQYQQEALDLYDLRIKHFGGEAAVLNRKAYAAYRYYRKEPTQYATLIKLFDRAYAAGKQQLSSANLLAYMDVVRLHRRTNRALTDEEILERYDQIAGELLRRGEAEKQTVVDNMLVETIDLTCPLVYEKFGVPFEQDTSDVTKASKVVALALANQCSDLPVFLVAVRAVQRQQPSAGRAKTIARLYEAKGQPTGAEQYYQEAVRLADTDSLKAEHAYQLAAFYQRAGQNKDARDAARQAVRLDPTLTEAYRLMGDLYYASFDACRRGEQQVADRAVYWAAYEQYRRAGRTDLMEQARQQFPTIETIFQEGYEERQLVSVGCWMNVTAAVRRR